MKIILSLILKMIKKSFGYQLLKKKTTEYRSWLSQSKIIWRLIKMILLDTICAGDEDIIIGNLMIDSRIVQ